jgi:two-component system phosphate regulon sensor histidine kinase PhoR
MVAKKKRFLWQLFLSYVVIAFVSLLAVTWYASSSMRHFFLQKVETDLEARARLFEKQLLEKLEPLDAKGIDQLCKDMGRSVDTRITVILPSGKVVGDSDEDPKKMDNHMDRPEVLKALNLGRGTSSRYSVTLEKSMMYVALPLKKDTRTVGVVRTSMSAGSIDKALGRIQIRIFLGGFIMAAFAAGLSYIISHRIKRPIDEIKRGAERFAAGDFQFRLPASDMEELAGLSETMNQMAGELQERINTITAQRNELEAVLSSMVEGVLAVDMEERVISMNDAAAKIFHCDPSEAEGRSIQEVVRHPDLQKFVGDALSSETPVEKDVVLYAAEEQILNGLGTALRDAQGKRGGALIVLNDVTQLRRLENIRRDFVANVSHEIKTPITAIKGFVETLRDGAAKNHKDAERFLEIIDKHVDRLEAIVEDLLSLSRIERQAEKEEILLQDGSIKDVLQTAIQVCQLKAAPKHIRVDLSCEEELTAKINPALLEQAVVNLLDNAIKYSEPESAVTVAATTQDQEILIAVVDHGSGIEKRHLNRLFERFYRVDRARSRKLGGTGLGLAIVKHIIQAHGGRVSVESQPGKGSTFTLHIPV